MKNLLSFASCITFFPPHSSKNFNTYLCIRRIFFRVVTLVQYQETNFFFVHETFYQSISENSSNHDHDLISKTLQKLKGQRNGTLELSNLARFLFQSPPCRIPIVNAILAAKTFCSGRNMLIYKSALLVSQDYSVDKKDNFFLGTEIGQCVTTLPTKWSEHRVIY